MGKIKDKLEENIVFWSLSMLLMGFVAGIGVYEGILKIAKLEVVSTSKLIEIRKKESIKNLPSDQQKTLNLLLAERLLSQLKITEGKQPPGNSDEEIDYKRLRKAVFMNLSAFQSNEVILRNALNTLVRQGQYFVSKHIDRLILDLPKIRTSRLRWLEDKVIPKLVSEQAKIPIGAQQINKTPKV